MLRFTPKLLFVILISITSFGQKLELGKVSKSELQNLKHKSDTAANAAFIFKKATTEFKYSETNGFTSTTVFRVKLKIYKKEGLKWANFKIPYYIGYEKLDDEYIEIVNGYTYNLENDNIVKSKVTGEGKFKEQVNENWEVKSVTFPNVRVGSIIELEYKFKTQNIETLPDFQFQYNIPVNYAEYRTEIPEFYIYNAIQRGYIDLKTDQKIEATSQSFEGKVGLVSQGKTLTYSQIVTVYNASNVPALKEEDYVNNIDNYYGEILHELQMVRMPNEKPKQIATTWEDVSKSIYEEEEFNTAISKFDYFAFDVKSLTNGVLSPEEKTIKIFNFVKNKMNWNGKFGYYPKNKMELAYKDKVGNSAEINLMLVSMLRMAGVDANPVLVSTRDNGVAPFPNRMLFNYVISSVNIDGKIILLDATNKHSDWNVLPIRVLNATGRLIKKDGTSSEINLMPASNSREIINILVGLNQQASVVGKIRIQYFDYNAMLFREKYNGIAEESYIEKLEKMTTGLEIVNYNVQNNIDLELPIVENYDFTSTNSVEIVGDKMYFSPFLFFATTENPFKQVTREYPVDFVYPNQEKYNITITIPDGYVVETLPQPKAVAMPDNIANFKYNSTTIGRQIQLLYTQEINQAIIGSEYYDALKNFFKEIITKQTEKIVLKKS